VKGLKEAHLVARTEVQAVKEKLDASEQALFHGSNGFESLIVCITPFQVYM